MSQSAFILQNLYSRLTTRNNTVLLTYPQLHGTIEHKLCKCNQHPDIKQTCSYSSHYLSETKHSMTYTELRISAVIKVKQLGASSITWQKKTNFITHFDVHWLGHVHESDFFWRMRAILASWCPCRCHQCHTGHKANKTQGRILFCGRPREAGCILVQMQTTWKL